MKGTAAETEGRAPALPASILTAEVKDQAASAGEERIRLTLREEGLELGATTARDGTRAWFTGGRSARTNSDRTGSLDVPVRV